MARIAGSTRRRRQNSCPIDTLCVFYGGSFPRSGAHSAPECQSFRNPLESAGRKRRITGRLLAGTGRADGDTMQRGMLIKSRQTSRFNHGAARSSASHCAAVGARRVDWAAGRARASGQAGAGPIHHDAGRRRAMNFPTAH